MSTLDEKLALLKYKVEKTPHIEINKKLCEKCKTKECTFFCPAGVYKIENGEIPNIEYENCLECSSCMIACKNKAIKWKHPKGGKGVLYKFS